MEVTVNVIDLDCADLSRAEPSFDVAVDLVGLATEEARAGEEVYPQQDPIVKLLCAASIFHVECGVEECGAALRPHTSRER